jgi:hypothetical protein
MNRQSVLIFLLFAAAIAACEPVAVQYPPGSAQHPVQINSTAPAIPQTPQVTGSQRWQYAWNKAMEGIVMGGSIAGPYGAGGGLVIGLLTGLFTADSHFNVINNQVVSEHQKDQQLEAAIEQELARQRGLDNQLASAIDSNASAEGSKPASLVVPPVPREAAPDNRSQDSLNLASLGKPVPSKGPITPFKNVEVRDVNGDGIPDLWIYYNPQKSGEIVRQEEATKGDGRVDTWSYFKDGQLVRRDVDSKGQGRPDTVFYYDNDKIAREERDETGQGAITYRATYQNGRLAKVEKDSGGSGRPDLWIYYDTSRDGEIVAKEERDLNGDGIPDLWTYYENGRLVRRDVSKDGLEILSRQERLPAPSVHLQQVSAPGS